MTRTTDLLGNPLTPREREACAVYEALKALAAHGDLPRCMEGNVRKALACMWQVMNDLDVEYEHLYYLGV